MGTTVKTSIDGKWVTVPQTTSEAKNAGWYLGADYTLFEYIDGGLDKRVWAISDWCHETFDIYAFKVFSSGVYFYHEQNAMLCQLKWAR